MELKINETDLPGLYQSANIASLKAQKIYHRGIAWYLILLIIASLFSFYVENQYHLFKIISTFLFLATLSIMIWLRITKPEDIWYNGRAVAESVKTRSWRWMMRAEPYIYNEDSEITKKQFINDLKDILKTNESLIGKLGSSVGVADPISNQMDTIRNLDLNARFNLYRKERVTDQALWYVKKSKFNKQKSKLWFCFTVVLHALAVILLLCTIMNPSLKLPIGVVAVTASSILTWLQTKKHNELSSSYTLTAHEIVLLKSESSSIDNEANLSDYIINCENAFSREHTQWGARKKK